MITYKGTPLFGKDSSISHTSEFFAIAGTILFWLIFLIFALVIKPQPKKKYKEVQIVLSSTPVMQKTEEAAAPSEQAIAPAAASAPEETLVEKTVETPKPTPAPKVEQKKVEAPKSPKLKPAKPKEVPTTYAVDPMEAFEKQTKQQPKKDFDWSQFDDEEADVSDETVSAETVQNNAPSFSGAAGTAAEKTSEKLTSQSSTEAALNDNVSDTTSKALEGIKNSTFRGNSANGVQSETNVKTKTSGSGKVEMEMSNGRSRALLNPEKPIIILSASAIATIDVSKTVSIRFRVLESGNVPRTDIVITPESILTQIVRDEIKNQISEWIFEPSDYTATATFEYKIIKN